MPKTAKTDAEWHRYFIKISRCNRLNLRGVAPRRGSRHHRTLQKIVNCPRWVNMYNRTRGNQVTLFTNERSTIDDCNCGYGQYHGVAEVVQNNTNPLLAAAPTETQQPAPPPPPIDIPFNIPQKPDAITGIGSKKNIEDVVKVHKQEGRFDLLIFGPTYGKCPHCGGSNIESTNVNPCVKTIRTLAKPRFVQGMGMKCNDTSCNGKRWQTFESTYVSTLPPRIQRELNAQVVGAADGICMEAVIQMRLGVTAAALEKTSRANLTIWHNYELRDKYKDRVKSVR